ncbi:hypothetical protein C8Q80DRAFT_1268487 [Daedaleopsis nitida]|nr:hypothetical protein C8Q80DRAFT_1268487 [Daedaleopsis nitida]
MIHLDHNHSPSITGPSKPQNLVLSNSPHPDHLQHWSSPARDARSFYQDTQDQFLSDSSKSPAHPDSSSDPGSATLPPATSGDAEDSSLPEPSPNSPADAPSPPADSTSSLTPPPDVATPNHAPDAPDDPPGKAATDNGGVENEERAEQAEDQVERASRQSTPLSELSSAPETAPDENGPADGVNDGGEGDGGSNNAVDGQTKASVLVKESQPSQQPPSTSSPYRAPASPGKRTTDNASGEHGVDALIALKASSSREIGQSAMLDGAVQPSGVTGKAPDAKVVSILELNSLLLRVSMDFQARAVPMTDPNFHQYSLRLQSNLTWLAAAADDNHKVSQNMMVLPIMQPPPVVEFADMDRILHLYKELPNIFAKEIARRQQSGLVNGNVKRERTEEPGQEGMHKRRDTGETKMQAPGPFATPGAGPSTPHPPSQPMQSVPGANATLSLSSGPVPRMGSPSMPPPPVPPGAMPNEAQLVAARRQAQIRAMQQQQHADGSRQMSPPSGMPSGMSMPNVAGPSSMPNMPQLTPQQMAMLSNMGPNAVQHFQILQTPNHPFLQLMLSQVPGFAQLPLQEKLQKMMLAQNMMRQQRSQAQAAAGSMGGFPQGGMQGGIVQHSGDGSPSRMSPVSQQSSMQPSFSQGNTVGDPRSMMTPQQQQMLASLTPHQRQLVLMQQQMMRGGGNMNQQMMNQQQMMQERMRLEQQRIAQAQAQAAAVSGQGSPSNSMGSPVIDGPQFPALRSNPSMPGIARTARTPSDSVPSPVSQQRLSMSGASPEEQQRAMMMQQAQRGMVSHMQSAGFGNGTMANPGYAAQMQQMGMGGGQGGGNAYGMGSPPGSSGGGGQMWGQGGGGGQGFPSGGPFMAPSPSASHDGMTPGRGASGTPVSHQQMGTPSGDQAGLGEMDFFNWQ